MVSHLFGEELDAHNALIHPCCRRLSGNGLCRPGPVWGQGVPRKNVGEGRRHLLDLKQTITDLWVVGNTAFVEGYFSGSTLEAPLSTRPTLPT